MRLRFFINNILERYRTGRAETLSTRQVETRTAFFKDFDGAVPICTYRDLKAAELEKTVREARFYTADGIQLYGWFSPPSKPSKPTILFFPGQGAPLKNRIPLIKHFSKLGYGVFTLDRRGSGQSHGRASEEGFYLDAEAASDYLVKQGIPTSRQIAWGNSWGTPMAAHLAHRRNLPLIVQSGITNLSDHLSTRGTDPALYSGIFDLTQKPVHHNVLILHGDTDESIPVWIPEKLKRFYGANAQLNIFRGEGHKIAPGAFIPTVERFLAGLSTQ